ncbi:uncharacterized protein LOC105194449 [Solenopsis invicta]|uniref:uncharacterized protein LOC105194449 n=1 Tax=Solenopsis invicta TaxID=13686 RepID=UPI00193E2969|nr:uncharacterized protein LOC105194449 [Solenopsis invicta]
MFFSDARRACCILIDTVADGLKYALDTNETEQEKIKTTDKNNQNKELRIQELYRKVYEEDTRDHEQKYINKTNFNNSNHKSIKKCKSKKFGTKHTVERKHERHRHNRHHLNVTNDVLSEPNAAMMNNPQQTTIIGEKCENDNVIILQDTSPKIRIATYSMLENKLKNNIDSRQENSLNKKTDFNTDPEIIDKSDTRTFKTPSQKDVRDIDTELDIKKLQNKQNFDCMQNYSQNKIRKINYLMDFKREIVVFIMI